MHLPSPSAPVASLPMYALGELRNAHDALWAALAQRLADAGLDDVPRALSYDGTPEEHWAHPRLFFSQTCGFPLVHAFRGRLRVVATPAYAAPSCSGAFYASLVVVSQSSTARRLDDVRGGVCAVNDRGSHSGMNVLRAMLAPIARGERFFRDVVVTGAHVDSLAAVRDGQADVCAIDAVTHALLDRHRPEALVGTRVLVVSPRAPALPYVTHGSAPDELVSALRAALADALADPALAEIRGALLLDGVSILADDAYAVVSRMAQEAAELGYPELA